MDGTSQEQKDKLDLRSGVLSRSDLFLLMESYKNTIELNTTLLDQQKLIIDGNRLVMESNVNICLRIEEVAKKLDVCAAELVKTHHQWNESRIIFNATNTEEHLKLKGYLNIVAVAIGSLCLGMGGIVIKALSIFHSWGSSIHMIESIAKTVGAG